MNSKFSTAVLAVAVTGAALASGSVYAQTKPIQSPPPPTQMDPAKRVPPPASTSAQQAGTAEPATSSAPESAPAQQVRQYPGSQQHHAPSTGASWEESGRGGAFLGVQGGKGWVYDSVDQGALAISAGYRWQAGPVWLVGVEAAAGRLGSTTDDGWQYSKVEYASIGVNARFNFGSGNPVYGLLRAGYFSADERGYGSADGGYAGIGLGMDFSRRFNMSLIYTNYVYFNELYWSQGDLYYDASRADMLMLGAEVRF